MPKSIQKFRKHTISANYFAVTQKRLYETDSVMLFLFYKTMNGLIKEMKKILCAVLCLIFLFSLSAVPATAAAESEKYYYADFNAGLGSSALPSGNGNNTVSVFANTGVRYTCTGGVLSLSMTAGQYLRLQNSAAGFGDYRYLVLRMKGKTNYGSALTGNAFCVWFGSFSNPGSSLYVAANLLTSDYTDVIIEMPDGYFDTLDKTYQSSLIITTNRSATVSLDIDEIYFTGKKTPAIADEEETEIICTDGDVNADGSVDVRDLVKLKRCLAKSRRCDIDGNGTSNADDPIFLKQFILGLVDLSARGKLYGDFVTPLSEGSFVDSGEPGEKIKLMISDATLHTQSNGRLNLEMNGSGAYIRFLNTVALTDAARTARYRYMVITLSGYACNSSGTVFTSGNVAKIWFGAWSNESQAFYISAESINAYSAKRLIIPLTDEMFTGIPNDYVSGLFIKSAGAAKTSLTVDEIRFCNNAPYEEITAAGDVALYNFPSSVPKSSYCNVTVNGKDCFVYETNVNTKRTSPAGNASDRLQLEKCEVVSFDMTHNADISVSLNGRTLQSVSVSPKAHAITPIVADNTATFRIAEPGIYTVEFNGSTSRALHIFANRFEDEKVYADTPNVIYFGPGEHYAGTIQLASDQTLYLAGGSVVHGSVVSSGNNITIRGRGYIDNSNYSRYAADGTTSTPMVPINLSYGRNISIEGVACLDPAGWAYNLFRCSDVSIQNVKIISSRQNGDGISVQSCNNVEVSNSFARTWDDSFVVKNYDGYSTAGIRFRDCQIWSDLAQAMEIGYETRGDSMSDIHFENITVLHAFHKAVISIHNGDHAAISNVSFNNITVEDAQMGTGDGTDCLIDIQVLYSKVWSKEPTRGNINGVTVSNVNVLSGRPQHIFLSGYDATHKVSNVDLRNIVILGNKVLSGSTLITQGGYTADISVS